MLGILHGRPLTFNNSSISSVGTFIGSPSDRHLRVSSKRKRQLSVQASKAKGNYSKTTKKPATPEKSAQVPAIPQAPRIDPNSNISVRIQQRLVKQKKAVEAAASPSYRAPTVTKAFRKDKVDPQERAEENRQREEQAAKNAKTKSELATLVNLYGTKGNELPSVQLIDSCSKLKGDEKPPVLLVDGYNVLMFWRGRYPQDPIATLVSEQTGLEQARLRLEEDLISYSSLRQVKVVVVYDAMGRGADPVYIDVRRSVRETKVGLIDVVFCSNQEADSWILQEAIILKQEKSCPHVVVASGDKMLGDSVTTHGAFTTPAQTLVTDVRAAIKEQNDRIRETQFKYGSSSLSQGMSAATRWQLEAWRHQKIARQRAQLHIPEMKTSVTVQLPQQDTEPQ